jgi:hypothetical protein
MIEHGWNILPFWTGVMMTLGVEAGLIILAVIVSAIVGAIKKQPD